MRAAATEWSSAAPVRSYRMRSHLRALRATWLSAVICASASCDGSRMVVGDQGGHSLSVLVRPPASLSNVAARLGWPLDAVPGAVVVLSRATASPGASDTVVSDSLGVAIFSSLMPGNYSIAASRTLTDSEIAQAGDALGGSIAFTTVITITLGDEDNHTTTLRVAPVDRGSLLFAEFAPMAQRTRAANPWYYHANYFRLFNNADTVVALAEKLFVEAFPSWYDVRPGNNCQTFASLMRDPAGIWAQLIYKFPNDAGTIGPGEAVLIVTDAIDHRPIGQGEPGFHDFSRADFEFIGSSDVDNPAVPNLVSVGPRTLDPLGHGWHAHELRAIYVLAAPVALDTLPRQYNTVWATGSNFVRIPNEAVLDVLSPTSTLYSPYAPCLPSVLPSVDAEEARVLPEGGGPLSVHRRVVRRRPDGSAILQRSRNSAADWYLGPMTPFLIP